MDKDEIEKYKKAGEITTQAVEYAKTLVTTGASLYDIAESIENKIRELGAEPAFPVNTSINEVAAHATPTHNDDGQAHGLIKIDLGAHIDGYVADTAFAIDLDNTEDNKNLIQAAEAALEHALEHATYTTELGTIGNAIQSTAETYGVAPIRNLSGHSIERYDLHSGANIPNVDNGSDLYLDEGCYAIEPFTTRGKGVVQNGKPSGIYQLEAYGNVRDTTARNVLQYIYNTYYTLPFCARWIYHQFGGRGLLALKHIEQAGLIHQFEQLVEESRKPVAQAEHTFLITPNKTIITTRPHESTT